MRTYDMHARPYRPEVGRFLSEDRFEAASGDLALLADPLTNNRYAFAGGNPVGNIEFDGHITRSGGSDSTSQAQQVYGGRVIQNRSYSEQAAQESRQQREEFLTHDYITTSVVHGRGPGSTVQVTKLPKNRRSLLDRTIGEAASLVGEQATGLFETVKRCNVVSAQFNLDCQTQNPIPSLSDLEATYVRDDPLATASRMTVGAGLAWITCKGPTATKGGGGGTRSRVTDDFADLIAERVEQTLGRVTARRLLRIVRAAGYEGSERSLRRAVASAKEAWREKQALEGRIYRPWVSEPGEWMLCDWGAAGTVPTAAGPRRLSFFSAVLGWSRFRTVSFSCSERFGALAVGLAHSFEQVGGVRDACC